MSIALELLEQRNPNTPAWKWKDIPAGDYWVRIQAGPGAASLPEDLDIDLPDAYTAVQVELFDQFGRRVNAQQILSKLSVRRSFTSQGVGKFISWQDLRSVLNFLESTTLF